MKTEYLDDECLHCSKKQLHTTDKIPHGRERYPSQQLLQCDSCKSYQLIQKKDLYGGK